LEALEHSQRARSSDAKSAQISGRTDEARPGDERLWNLAVDPYTDQASNWQNQKVQTTPSHQLAFFANLKNRPAANKKKQHPVNNTQISCKNLDPIQTKRDTPPTRLLAR
jgi:hypothetical protein